MAQILKETVRQRILQAAEEAMETYGSALTMRQIAKAAGVTPGNLYRYYAGKQELLAAVTEPVMTGLAQLVRQHTGEQLVLGQPQFCFRLAPGAEGLAQLRSELYARLVPALLDLFRLAEKYPRPMAILCQQNEVSSALMDWFYALMQDAVEQLVRLPGEQKALLEALIRAEGQAFCQGVIVLMQQSAGQKLPQRQQLIRAFLAIHVEGILWVIDTSVQQATIQYRGEDDT